MTNVTQAAVLVMIGGISGAGGLSLLMQRPAPAEPSTTDTIQIYDAHEVAPTPPAPVAEAPPVVSVSYSTTGSIESDAPRAAFAEFNITASADVADVAFTVVGATGGRVDEAIGVDATKSGASLTVDIGELRADEERTVIVAFTLDGDSARFKTHTAYRDLHTGSLEKVLGASQGHSISRKIQDRDVYVNVRRAYSDAAIATARSLREQEQYADALSWVDDAYTRNVEVGMALRLTGGLAGAQAELGAWRKELELLNRPKPKVKRPQPKRIEIDFFYGDQDSPSTSKNRFAAGG